MVLKATRKRGQHGTDVHRMNVYDIDIESVCSLIKPHLLSPAGFKLTSPCLDPWSRLCGDGDGGGLDARAGLRVVRALRSS